MTKQAQSSRALGRLLHLGSSADKLRLAAALVLLAGLFSAALVWWFNRDDNAALLRQGYEIVGGQVYASQQAQAARDMQLERIGGHAAVWAANFNEWLAERFEGRRLAVTLLVLAGVVALVLARIAVLMDEIAAHEETEAGGAPDS
ncbi:MAG: hypothetical protein JO224_10840 [Pelomonas sp.]|nr:hypothetical protein [Roseateles sp.]